MPNVLLVADESWVVNEVISSLALGSWDVEVTSDPRGVAQEVVDQQAQAVIIDMQVGSMGGMAIVREVRQSFDEADRPHTVLLLDREADEFIAKRAGADAFAIKPITSSILREALGGVEPATEEAVDTPRTRARKQAPSASSEEE